MSTRWVGWGGVGWGGVGWGGVGWGGVGWGGVRQGRAGRGLAWLSWGRVGSMWGHVCVCKCVCVCVRPSVCACVFARYACVLTRLRLSAAGAALDGTGHGQRRPAHRRRNRVLRIRLCHVSFIAWVTMSFVSVSVRCMSLGSFSQFQQNPPPVHKSPGPRLDPSPQ